MNATVRTVDDCDTVAAAVLIRDGKLAAVGAESEVCRSADADVETIDVHGATVVPGFIELHNHLGIAAFAPDFVACSTLPISTLAEVLEAFESAAGPFPPGSGCEV